MIINESHIKRIQQAWIKEWDNLVFCDIDWTIYRDSLYLEMFYCMIEDWYVNKNDIDLYKELEYNWKNRQEGYKYDTFLWWTIDIVKKTFNNKKIHIDKLNEYANRILEKNINKTIIFTIKTLNELKNNWWKIILISGSPQKIVDIFANYLDFHVAIGTINHINEEWFLLETNDLMARSIAKQNIINYIKTNYNIWNTIALWDTNWDYNMLLDSNLWYAINPTFELYNQVKGLENVVVIIERKDLILELDINARDYIKYDNLKF